MDDGKKLSLEQIRALLEGSQEVHVQASERGELYEWVEQTLREHGYGAMKRSSKGLVRRYIAKTTGLSRAQVTRLVRRYQKGGGVQLQRYRRHRFASRYTAADVELLAEGDA